MKVEIENVGAIERVEFDMPEGKGGVILLTGSEGVGKTTALAALDGLLGGDKVALTARDGSDKGLVRGFGKTLTVGKKQTTTGSLDVPTINGRVNLSDLIDPGIKDPEAADRARVRVLASLGGVRLTADDLLGDYRDVVSSYVDLDEAQKFEDDPVSMATMFKRQLQKIARDKLQQIEVKQDLEKSKRIEAGDVSELSGDVDYASLTKEHQSLVGVLMDLRSKQARYDEAERTNASAMESIAAIGEVDVATLDAEIEEGQSLVDGLQERLKNAQLKLAAKKAEREQALAKQRSKAALEKTIVAIDFERPTDEAIDKALSVANEAQSRVISADLLRVRKEKLAAADEIRKEIIALDRERQVIIKCADDVHAAVQRAIPKGPISIVDGTLVVEHGRRGKPVRFNELSTGERTKHAIKYGIQATGVGGVLVLNQEIWQALGDVSHDEIRHICDLEKVWVVTGAVSDGELRVAM